MGLTSKTLSNRQDKISSSYLFLRYQYKRQTYKHRTVQMLDAQTSNQYKGQTRTNVGLVKTLDWFKRRTSTNVGRVHL